MALRLRNSMLANIAKHHLSLATHQDPDKALVRDMRTFFKHQHLAIRF